MGDQTLTTSINGSWADARWPRRSTRVFTAQPEMLVAAAGELRSLGRRWQRRRSRADDWGGAPAADEVSLHTPYACGDETASAASRHP